MEDQKEDFWDNIESSYPVYPTVRHRRRFILKILDKLSRPGSSSFVFDFGCGTGDMIIAVRDKYGLRDDQIGGCDMSIKSIESCRQKTSSPYFYQAALPQLDRLCDIIICSEVIEHVEHYQEIIGWIKENLRPGGVLLLSTQGGKMHKIDVYSGHVQTFLLEDLKKQLAVAGLEPVYARRWGWPFFTLQKMLTDISFKTIKDTYLEGSPSRLSRYFFSLVYLAYFIEDPINLGPQLYIGAIKK